MSASQLAVVHQFLRALNANDTDMLSDKSFSHRYMPSSHIWVCVFRYTLLSECLGTSMSDSPHLQIKIEEVVQQQDHIVILRVEDDGRKRDGTPYRVEYIVFIHFTLGTDKIYSVVEYQDSLYVAREFAGWYDESRG
ncbi:hypothetical protein C8Q80DRAFT_304264 [Daedaleopsis nitida]|nr:hypothetical protein C8Q80DRAFT_304264 [Daedaleopsis nitida]